MYTPATMAVPPTVSTAAVHTPRLMGPMAFLSFFLARTKKMPMMVAMMPMAGMRSGKMTVATGHEPPARWT